MVHDLKLIMPESKASNTLEHSIDNPEVLPGEAAQQTGHRATGPF